MRQNRVATKPLRLRPATLADARFLFQLRNDPTTRAASFHTGELRFADHVAWLGQKLADRERTTRLYIALAPNGTRVGQVRLDWPRGKRYPEIAVGVAPSQRGRGMGTRMIEAAVRTIRPATPVVARIRPDNHASLTAFARAGFRLSGRPRKRPAPHVVLLYRPEPR